MSVASHRLGTGTVRWVKGSDLHVRKPGVNGVCTQRDLRPAWVKAHTANFNRNGLGTFVVVWDEKDQCYYVIDGQHRRALLEAMDLLSMQVPCLVYEDLSISEEADLFLIHNDKGNVDSYQKFRVRITSGEPIANGVMRVLAAESLQLSQQQGTNYVRATSALERIYKGADRGLSNVGPSALQRTLHILREAYGNSSSSFDGTLIEGLGSVILEHGTRLDDAHMVRALQRRGGGGTLVGAARGLQQALGGSLTHSVSATMVNHYNHGLSKKSRLPSWIGQSAPSPTPAPKVKAPKVKTLTKSFTGGAQGALPLRAAGKRTP